jgi:hypothetical protein
MPSFPAAPPVPQDLSPEMEDFLRWVLEVLEMYTTDRGGDLTIAVTKQMLQDSGMDVSVLDSGEPTYVFTKN